MKKPFALFLIAFVLLFVGFATWQLFLGNLGAAFSPVPLLLLLYLFMKQLRN